MIQIEADGALTQEVLMKKLPETQEEADASASSSGRTRP